MALFVVMIFLPIIFCLCPVKFKWESKDVTAFKIFFIALFLLLALRDPIVGNDTAKYASMFHTFRKMPWQNVFNSDWEVGYVILNKIIGLITNSSQVYLTIVSLLIVLPFYFVYKKNSELPILTISLFLILPTFTMMFSGLRQALAISIGLLVFEAAKRKKIVLCLLLVLLAICFHKSAFILILILPIYHIKVTKKATPFIAILITLVLVFNRPIFSFLEKTIGGVYNSRSDETGAYTMLVLFIMFAVFSLIIPDEKQNCKELIGLRNILFLACVLQCFVPLHELAMRMNYYFIIFIPLLLPKVIKSTSFKLNQIATMSNIVLTIFFLTFFIIRAATGNVSLTVFPYHFFWESLL